eukprot:3113301-Pyramimonas_sp.AAC.1
MGSRCRQRAELWLNSPRPLHSFEDLVHNLLGLALDEIAGQRLGHARADWQPRFERRAREDNPPAVRAKLRAP